MNEMLIEKLNHALNREVSTSLRYLLQAASIKGAEWAPVREMYDEEVGDEMEHARYLVNKIVMLGGRPTLEPDLTPPPAGVKEMLEHDMAEEEVDVKGYLELAAMAEEAGLADLKLHMEDQAADEAAHAEKMRRFLG
jgi:bacterioferritin (cytochrome b1)